MTESDPRAWSKGVWPDHPHEEVIEPEFPIIDPHHHVRDRGGGLRFPFPDKLADIGFRYLLPEFLADIYSGHNIIATVAIEENDMYREDGPRSLAPVGETEFLNGIAAMFASGKYGPTRACAAIVGAADLMLGERVQDVLEAHINAGGGRFRGIRCRTAWDKTFSSDRFEPDFFKSAPEMLGNSDFRRGVACLARNKLSLDVHIFHSQLPELTDLAKAFPDTTIILNHYGIPMGVQGYAGKQAEVFAYWRPQIFKLAQLANVYVKFGSIKWANLPIPGYDPKARKSTPTSEEFAKAWGPYVETCVEAFGASRCMCESNFPPEKMQHSYVVLWNTFKRITAQYSKSERASLLRETAAKAYRLPQFSRPA